MWTAVVMSAVILGVCGLLYRHLVFFAFDESVSRVFGVRAKLLHYLLLVMLAVVIVVAIRLVGLILVSGLLIVPGATALLLSRRMTGVLWLSAAVGVGGTVGGLVLSFEVGSLSPGPCIVAVMTLLFGLAYAWQKVGRWRTAGS
jgi:ABC-type Mn2+/Zn2+ transport system permease subunit